MAHDSKELTVATNNALVQSFTVNNLNQLSNATRSGSLTVAGATTIAATSVTVADNGNSPVSAIRYADATFARTNVTLLNGNNTFVAVATDSLGRGDTNTVTVNLPATVTFLYDLNGNLRTNGTRVLEYDDENQLTRVTEPSAWKAEIIYDGAARRKIRREFRWSGSWVLTNEVRYVYDGNLNLQERDQFNLPKLTYTRGLDLSGSLEGAGGIGGLLALTQNSTTPMTHVYYHADGNGNVTCLVDTNQNVVARYLYGPFGNTLFKSGPLADVNHFRFSSMEHHEPSGIVLYKYRPYVPELHRWGNRDPIGEKGGNNLYSFIKNSSVNLVDPFGLKYGNPVPPCAPYPDCLNKPPSPPNGLGKGKCIARAKDQFDNCMEIGSTACSVGCLFTGPAGYVECVALCEASILAGCTTGLAINVARCLLTCDQP